MHLKELVGKHNEFFKSKERRVKLKEFLTPDDGENAILEKMLAVVFNVSDVNCVSFLLAHFNAFAQGDDTIEKELARFNLTIFYWNLVSARYNYISDEPGIYDFLLEVFNANTPLSQPGKVNRESKILVSVWKDTISYQDAFRKLSDKVSADLQIESAMQQEEPEKLLEDNLFRLTDKMIISGLCSKLSNGSWSLDETLHIVKNRENKYWYSEYKLFYAALKEAASLLAFVKTSLPAKIESFSEGVASYAKEWYKADQFYRKFIQYYRKTSQNRVLEPLAQKIEKVYNHWLLPLNKEWQNVVTKMDKWDTFQSNTQRRFFNTHIKPVIRKGLRMFVIISDGFRYECGEEFVRLLEKEQRFKSSLDYAFTGIPSYTQLGMAALLPNKKLEITQGTDAVSVDDIAASGLAGRSKVLDKLEGFKATAINAD